MRRARCSWDGHRINIVRVAFIRKTYGLKTLRDRLHDAGMLTANELARKLDVALPALKRWRKRGLLRGRIFNDKGEYMYDDPGKNPAVRARSEEHTSELQSHHDLVCRLLLEKK